MHLPGSPELGLSFLIGCADKVTFVLTLVATAACALRSRSAATRHHMWALGIACSLALPILTLLLPSWHSGTLGSAARHWSTAHARAGNIHLQKLPSTVIDAAAASPLSGHLVSLILLLWAFGALFILVKLLAGLSRLAFLSARAAQVVEESWAQMIASQCARLGIMRPVKILLCANPASMPLTWVFSSPASCFPREQQTGPQIGEGPSSPTNSRTSPATTGLLKSAANWLARCIGFIPSCGLPPQSCGARANSLATILS